MIEKLLKKTCCRWEDIRCSIKAFFGYGNPRELTIRIHLLGGEWKFYVKCWGLGTTKVIYEEDFQHWVCVMDSDGNIVAKIKEQVFIDLATKRGWWDQIWNK